MHATAAAVVSTELPRQAATIKSATPKAGCMVATCCSLVGKCTHSQALAMLTLHYPILLLATVASAAIVLNPTLCGQGCSTQYVSVHVNLNKTSLQPACPTLDSLVRNRYPSLPLTEANTALPHGNAGIRPSIKCQHVLL